MSIERGTRVRVRMASSGIFPWQTSSPHWEAVYLSGPAGPGDVYVLRVHQPDGRFADDISEHIGRTVELNGNSRDFVGLYPSE